MNMVPSRNFKEVNYDEYLLTNSCGATLIYSYINGVFIKL